MRAGRRAELAHRRGVALRAGGDRQAAGDAGIALPAEQAHQADQQRQRIAEEGKHRQRHDQERHAGLEVGEHQDDCSTGPRKCAARKPSVVPTIAEIASRRTAISRRDADRDDQARQHVAAELVGAQRMQCRRTLPGGASRVAQVERGIGIGRRRRRKCDHQHQATSQRDQATANGRPGSAGRSCAGEAGMALQRASSCMRPVSVPPLRAQARVEAAVGEVDDEVGRSPCQAATSNRMHCTTARSRLATADDQQPADARPGEHALDHDGARDQAADHEADDGDGRDGGVGQRVARDDTPPCTPLAEAVRI